MNCFGINVQIGSTKVQKQKILFILACFLKQWISILEKRKDREL